MRNYASKLTDSIQESDGAEYTKLSETMEHVFKLSKLTQEVGMAHERLLKRASEAIDSETVETDGLDNKLKITNETLEQITKAILVAEFGGTDSQRISDAQPVMLAAGAPVEQESTSGNKESTDSSPDDDNV
jgi:fructose-specific phosphotransferase system component IIB